MSGFFSAFSWVNMRFLMMGLGVTIQVAVSLNCLEFHYRISVGCD